MVIEQEEGKAPLHGTANVSLNVLKLLEVSQVPTSVSAMTAIRYAVRILRQYLILHVRVYINQYLILMYKLYTYIYRGVCVHA